MDNTLLFCPAKESVLINYKRILDCFGLMSGLKISYEKLALIPFSCTNEWVDTMKSML